MDALPLLVVHGAWVWKLIVVAVVLAVLGALRLASRLGERAAVRRAVAALDGGGAGVVRGILRGTGAPLAITVRARTGSTAEASQRADDVWIETEHGRVALRDPLRVVAGSRVVVARGGVPAETPGALLALDDRLHRRRAYGIATIRVAELVSVSAGDRVVATGRLEPVASSEPSGYREAATAFELRAGDGEAIAIAAAMPRAAVPRPTLIGTLVIAALCVSVSYGVMKACGERWREDCWSAHEHGSDAPVPAVELTNTHACALAAAMPGSRESALYGLLRWFDDATIRSDVELQQLLGVAELDDGCDGVMRRLAERGRYAELADKAQACGDPRTQYGALVALGRFDDAAAIVVPGDADHLGLPTATVLILAGRWAAAADRAAAKARALTETPPVPDEPGVSALEAKHYQCLAELLLAHAGDTTAIARLRALATGSLGDECAPMLAELVTGDERRDLRARKHAQAFMQQELISEQLELVDGSGEWPSFSFEPEQILAQTEFATYRLGTLWLAGLVPHPGDAAPELRVDLLRARAVKQVFDGDVAAAATTAKAAVALDAELARGEELLVRYERRDVALLPAAVALYTPATDAAFDLDHPVGLDDATRAEDVRLRHDQYELLLLRAGIQPDGEHHRYARVASALADASRGDGDALADLAGGDRVRDGELLAVWPRLRAGADALRAGLRFRPAPAGGELARDFAWSTVAGVVERRDLLRAAGLVGDAARWDDIYRRYDRALSDRDRLAALMFWEL